MKIKFENIQQLGRALMLPIALLPVAGILLRFGQPDLLNLKYLANAGNIIFTSLPLLFALGVAVGLAKDNNGTAALAATVGYLIMTTILSTIDKSINTGVLGGIIVGCTASYLYNRYKDIKLPDYLAFFGGKRFIPIITGLSSVALGIVLGYIWPPVQTGINTLGIWLLKSGYIGLFIYGVLNRVLLLTGLHHVLNNLVWFVFGDFTNQAGIVVHGDIARFMSGDKSAGFFMSGYFPIFMFGLPAACLAMYHNAHPHNKKAVAGLLLSMALTSFLTGVTEPIEFSFVFLAPALFAIHALLTGLCMSLMYLLDIHLGFTFSAGLIDYVLFFKQATNPIYVIPIGILVFVTYYVIFSFFIRRFNLATIGRDEDNVSQVSIAEPDSRALQFIESLGGADNLVSVDSCTTRLRLIVKDSAVIDRELLKSLGARGIIAPTKESLQIILGPVADIIAGEIREALDANHIIPHVKHNHEIHNHEIPEDIANVTPDPAYGVTVKLDNSIEAASSIVDALGGKSNIDSISIVAITRLRISIKQEKDVDISKLSDDLELINITKNIKQIYVGNNSQSVYLALEELI